MIVSALYFTYEKTELLGYKYFAVQNQNIQREIPEGSLVFIKNAPPDSYVEGDDITFLRPGSKVDTNRIYSVTKNFKGTKMLAFETKGIENPLPDSEKVFAPNVIGKVHCSVPTLGAAASFITSHMLLTFAVLGGLLIFSTILRILFKPKLN